MGKLDGITGLKARLTSRLGGESDTMLTCILLCLGAGIVLAAVSLPTPLKAALAAWVVLP